jgi:hypothetical protein
MLAPQFLQAHDPPAARTMPAMNRTDQQWQAACFKAISRLEKSFSVPIDIVNDVLCDKRVLLRKYLQSFK